VPASDASIASLRVDLPCVAKARALSLYNGQFMGVFCSRCNCTTKESIGMNCSEAD